jgi:hypothetical protein
VASPSATGEDRGLARFDEIDVISADRGGPGSGRDGYLEIRSPCSGLVGAETVISPFGPVVPRSDRGEIASRGITDQDDTASVAAVTAVGTAARNVRLTPEGNGAISTASPLYPDLDPVVEHGLRLRVASGRTRDGTRQVSSRQPGRPKSCGRADRDGTRRCRP